MSHQPQIFAARGQVHQGGWRFHAPLMKRYAQQQRGNTTLKYRKRASGGDQPDGDGVARLLEREHKHINKKRRVGDALPSLEGEGGVVKEPDSAVPVGTGDSGDKRVAGTNVDDKNAGGASGSGVAEAPSLEEQMAAVDWSQFSDSDQSDAVVGGTDSDTDDSSSGSEDEEALLLAELERIKAEKAAEQAQRKAEEEEERESKVLMGNPLLQGGERRGLKRRWGEDVVFRNQARKDSKPSGEFINDLTRSSFHRNFLKKFMR